MKSILLLLVSITLLGCSNHSDDDQGNPKPTPNSLYFPENNSDQWEKVSMQDLGWNTNAVQPLKNYLVNKHSKSFIILVNGRIAMEEYFNGHTANTNWEWNSAGKTLVGTTFGIAEQEGYTHINDKVSTYLGNHWTSEPLDKEDLIQNKHLLTMTSGLNDQSQWVTQANLTYLADAGTRWSYHNVFQKLMDVITQSNAGNFDNYFNMKIRDKIGMNGYWNHGIIYTIYHSNTRSMARFGLLAMNKGKWKDEVIINPSFFNASINTSQNINPSYGYFWWLNGKSSYLLPGGQTVYNGALIPNAPHDMYAAMGASDQRIYVIPSKKIVIVRMGDASNPQNPSFALSGFDVELWNYINALIP